MCHVDSHARDLVVRVVHGDFVFSHPPTLGACLMSSCLCGVEGVPLLLVLGFSPFAIMKYIRITATIYSCSA